MVTGVPTLLSANTTTIGPTTAVAGAPCASSAGTCQVVDYTFNEAVSVNNTAASLATFYAYLSDGSYDHPVAVTEPSGTNNIAASAACGGAGTTACSTGSTTVRAYYAVASLYNEYLVKAAVSGGTTTAELSSTAFGNAFGCSAAQQTAPATCGVVSTTSGHPNTPGSAPIGGNTGGHATGFTTAPDAFGTTFDTLTNVVSVTFDSRVYRDPVASSAVAANQFQLLDGNGNAISGGTNISACSPSTIGFPCALSNGSAGSGTVQSPGTNTVWVIYPSPAVQVGNAKSLEIRGWVGNSLPGGAFAVEGGDRFGGAFNFARRWRPFRGRQPAANRLAIVGGRERASAREQPLVAQAGDSCIREVGAGQDQAPHQEAPPHAPLDNGALRSPRLTGASGGGTEGIDRREPTARGGRRLSVGP